MFCTSIHIKSHDCCLILIPKKNPFLLLLCRDYCLKQFKFQILNISTKIFCFKQIRLIPNSHCYKFFPTSFYIPVSFVSVHLFFNFTYFLFFWNSNCIELWLYWWILFYYVFSCLIKCDDVIFFLEVFVSILESYMMGGRALTCR